MFKILAPLIDSIISYLIEQPIQYYFYINFKKFLLKTSAIFITFISIIINLFIIFIVILLYLIHQ